MTERMKWSHYAAKALILAALPVAGCGPAQANAPAAPAPAAPSAAMAPKEAPPAAAAKEPEKPFDPCSESKPIDKTYSGILRTARCDQEKFLMMADVATQLGVECSYCHLQDPTNPKKFDYVPMTPRKEIANWMSMHLMQAVKPADGSEIRCKSCHTDEAGKPIAKILHDPRNATFAHEWMTLTMVNKFTTQDGGKLKCKSCHGDNFTMPGWKSKVILQTAQIPAH